MRRSEAAKVPLWLWPTILSLDAPTIAIVWLALFAASFRVSPGWPVFTALGLWVWLIYATDRLLDSRKGPPPGGEVPRHRFYRDHRLPVTICAVAVAAIAAVISFGWIQPAIRREAIGLAILVAIYFAITHLARPKGDRYWPKELLVGLLFATGVCLPVRTLLGRQRLSLLAPFILLVAVFWINALAIECWESAPDRASRMRLRAWISRILAPHLAPASAGLVILAGAIGLFDGLPSGAASIDFAIAFSALFLTLLEINAGTLTGPARRVLADAALLTPVLFLWSVR
jgi:hypothetical protein